MAPCVSLPWSCFHDQILRMGVPGSTGGWEQGWGQATGRVFIPALEGICNLRIQDF